MKYLMADLLLYLLTPLSIADRPPSGHGTGGRVYELRASYPRMKPFPPFPCWFACGLSTYKYKSFSSQLCFLPFFFFLHMSNDVEMYVLSQFPQRRRVVRSSGKRNRKKKTPFSIHVPIPAQNSFPRHTYLRN